MIFFVFASSFQCSSKHTSFHDNLPEIGILDKESDQIGFFQLITTQRVFHSQKWSRYEKHSIFSTKVESFQTKGLGWVFAPIRYIRNFHLRVLGSKIWNFRFWPTSPKCACRVQICTPSPFWATSGKFYAQGSFLGPFRRFGKKSYFGHIWAPNRPKSGFCRNFYHFCPCLEAHGHFVNGRTYLIRYEGVF